MGAAKKNKKDSLRRCMIVFAAGLMLTACAGRKSPYDVDLTDMSSNMIYGQVSEMVNDPENFEGKSVRLDGYFSYYSTKEGSAHFAAVVPDALACCEQGIEFVPDSSLSYPEDFPSQGEDIRVTGVFASYSEDGIKGFHLENAVMTLR